MKVEEDERKKLRGQSKEKGKVRRGDKKEKEQKKLVKAIISVGTNGTIFKN